MPSDLVISTWPIRAPTAKQVFWGLLGAGSHQASVECTLVMKHQGCLIPHSHQKLSCLKSGVSS